MIKEKILNYVNNRQVTLLGVGPMSLICVDSVIELCNQYKIPIMLIASRRQIDSSKFGGGYVNNWSTEKFAEYVMNGDKFGNIYLARDHGGPWQSDIERDRNLGLRLAMESAKNSYKADIDSGFQILHLDPSIDIHGPIKLDESLDRLFELYEFCYNYAKQKGKEIIFEIGTEEQSGTTNTQEELEYTLSKTYEFCDKNQFSRPTFVVVQTGTRVKELRNVGSLDTPFRVKNEVPPEIQIPQMVNICNKFGIFMKEHNADYLSNEVLSWHPRLGIHAANVAPEFGVQETLGLLEVLEDNDLHNYAEEFMQISYNSKKWKKWVISNNEVSFRTKSIISGHYIFSKPEFVEMKRKVVKILEKKDICLDLLLKEKIKISILRYLRNFRLVS